MLHQHKLQTLDAGLSGETISSPSMERYDDNPQPFVVDVVSNHNLLDTLEKEWRQLEAECANITLFQSFDWCKNFVEFSGNGDNFEPRIFLLREGKKLIGLLPLAIHKNRGLSILTGFAEPFQQYTDMLLLSKVDVETLRPVILQAIKQSGADFVHLGQVRADSSIVRLFGKSIPKSGEVDGAPFVTISEFDGYDDYTKTVRSKTRKNLRNALNRLERDNPVNHEVAGNDTLLLKEVISRTFEGREAWLEQLGITSRAFKDDSFKVFLDRFANQTGSANKIELFAMSLKHGEKVLSDQWGFVYRGRYYAFMANWNPDYEAFSPGRMHLGKVIEACFEKGYETVDFLIPASSYKMTWTNNAVIVSDRVLPITVKGWLYANLWLDVLRPAAKRLFFRLPAGLRQKIVKKL